ncbi:MAG: tRNA pseudouridine(38-40) synthase TruA [Lachnospiraceae bacterium]|nr:tRNA pseudouridine(38-40) synthase TruA [Lachnospiraceae bacterium]
MKRVKLIVAYDGTNYHGWQIQDNGITIEEILNKELSELLREDIKVIGASRTDSGVHALGNVAVFDTETRIPAEKISFALNQRLPEDIRIQESCEVAEDFHPRFCDTIKTYQYRIWNSRFPNPMVRLYSKFVYYNIDIDKMQQAANYLVGEHDFKSFCSTRTQVENTVRRVTEITFSKEGNMVTMTIKGYGFLYNMVRIIMGTLLKCGMGMYEPEHVKEILEARDRAAAGPKAEACGLTLVGIEYARCNEPC